MTARGQIHRAVFYQEQTGHVVDAHARFAMPSPIVSTSENYVTIDGAEEVISRDRTLEFQLLRECDISHLRQMKGQCWPVRCLVIGFDRHDVWAVGESLDMIDIRRGPANMAGALARLQSHVFDGAIYQSDNIIEGIPWACTSSTALPQAPAGGSGSGAAPVASGSGMVDQWALLRLHQSGWVGPFWDPMAAGTSVDFSGVLDKGSNPSPNLSMVLPIQGATLLLTGGWTGSVSYFDWSGNALPASIAKTVDINDVSGKVPDGTWSILITVLASDEQPIVRITSPGPLIDPRPGIYVGSDGVQAGIPIWSS